MFILNILGQALDMDDLISSSMDVSNVAKTAI